MSSFFRRSLKVGGMTFSFCQTSISSSEVSLSCDFDRKTSVFLFFKIFPLPFPQRQIEGKSTK